MSLIRRSFVAPSASRVRVGSCPALVPTSHSRVDAAPHRYAHGRSDTIRRVASPRPRGGGSRPAPGPTSAGPTDQAWSTAPTGSCPMSPYPDPKGCPYLRSQMTTPASCAIPSNQETSSYTMQRRSTVPDPTARPAPEDEPFPSGTAGTASTIWSGPALPPRPTTLPTATSGQATRW